MTDYTTLTDRNYIQYAMRVYDNPQCERIDEFEEDLKRVHYIKKLLNKYVNSGELKPRHILNHITVLHNVFGIKATAKMLFFKLEEDLYPALKTFLISKYAMPKKVNGINTDTIEMDDYIISELRDLFRGTG